MFITFEKGIRDTMCIGRIKGACKLFSCKITSWKTLCGLSYSVLIKKCSRYLIFFQGVWKPFLQTLSNKKLAKPHSVRNLWKRIIEEELTQFELLIALHTLHTHGTFLPCFLDLNSNIIAPLLS